jgi:hypothetical protein
MKHPNKVQALADYYKVCREAERLDRPDVIQKYLVHGQMTAQYIHEVVRRMWNELKMKGVNQNG